MAVTIVDYTPSYSELAQEMGNQFPDWHVARLQKGSMVSKLLNASAAKPLDNIVTTELTNLFTQRSITLADTKINFKAFSISSLDAPKINKPVNRLINSNFERWSNLAYLPDNWNYTIDAWDDMFKMVQVNQVENYIGGSSLLVSNRLPTYFPYGNIEVYQDYILDVNDHALEWTAFCFYKKDPATTIVSNLVYFFIRLTYIDDTTLYTQLSIDNVSEWTRQSIGVTGAKQIKSIRVGLKWSPLLVDSEFSFIVDNFMLHNSLEELPWVNHSNDKPEFIGELQDGVCIIGSSRTTNKKIRAIKINFNDINKSLLPSSANFYNVVSPDVPTTADAITNAIPLRSAVLQDGTEWLQSMIAVTEAVRVQFNWPLYTVGRIVKYDPTNTTEIYGTYLPVFSIVNDLDNIDKYSLISDISMTSVVEKDNYLYIAAKINTTNSLKYSYGFKYMLLVAENILPKQEDSFDTTGVDYENNPSYIRVIRMLLLDTPATVFDTQVMRFIDHATIEIIMANGYKGLVRLNYDYFAEDTDSKQAILLRDYSLELPDTNIILC